MPYITLCNAIYHTLMRHGVLLILTKIASIFDRN